VCGRYVVKSPSAKLKVKFHLDEVPLFEPRYNLAPTQLVPAVRQVDGMRRLAMLRWGLIPSWAKDAKIGYRRSSHHRLMSRAALTAGSARADFDSDVPRACRWQSAAFHPPLSVRPLTFPAIDVFGRRPSPACESARRFHSGLRIN
jgi:hypothetical protein